MSQEHEGIAISGLYINLQEASITLEAGGLPVAKLGFTSRGVIYFQSMPQVPEAAVAEEDLPTQPTSTVPVPPEVSNVSPRSDAETGKEKGSTVVIMGRLKSQPQEGKPDRRGKPTAWARLAAYEEGNQEAHMYLATFHRHTARVALSLPQGCQISAEGYIHPADDPSGKRTDTFSIINLLSYPGKPDRS